MNIATSIAAMSVSSHQGQLKQAVSTAVIKKALDFQTTQANQLIETLQEIAPPSAYSLDIKI